MFPLWSAYCEASLPSVYLRLQTSHWVSQCPRYLPVHSFLSSFSSLKNHPEASAGTVPQIVWCLKWREWKRGWEIMEWVGVCLNLGWREDDNVKGMPHDTAKRDKIAIKKGRRGTHSVFDIYLQLSWRPRWRSWRSAGWFSCWGAAPVEVCAGVCSAGQHQPVVNTFPSSFTC